jgi:hypothetical protein
LVNDSSRAGRERLSWMRFDVINTPEHTRGDRPARRPRRFSQPTSTAALRPSQQRAAANLAARHELRSTGYWLRRLTSR